MKPILTFPSPEIEDILILTSRGSIYINALFYFFSFFSLGIKLFKNFSTDSGVALATFGWAIAKIIGSFELLRILSTAFKSFSS